MPRGTSGVVSLVKNGDAGQLRVPKEVFEVLEANAKSVRYTVSVTDEGILFKPHVPEVVSLGELPEWLKKAV